MGDICYIYAKTTTLPEAVPAATEFSPYGWARVPTELIATQVICERSDASGVHRATTSPVEWWRKSTLVSSAPEGQRSAPDATSIVDERGAHALRNVRDKGNGAEEDQTYKSPSLEVVISSPVE